MSSIPLLDGATHVLKLKPNNALIPSTINDIDQLFDLSNLFESKYSNWRSTVSTAGNIGIINDVFTESVRFIDSNFNMTAPTGSLWFKGTAQQDAYYYLQAGNSMSKTNSVSVFSDHVGSYGFLETTGNIHDRCNTMNVTYVSNLTYSQTAIIDKGIQFNNGSYCTVENATLLAGSKLTILVLAKFLTGDKTVYNTSGTINFQTITGLGTIIMFTSTGIAVYDDFVDDFSLMSLIFDGTQTGDTNRLKVFKNKTLQTPLSWLVPGVGSEIETTGLSAGLQFGQSGVNSHGMVIDEVRLIKRALSSDEITLRYNQYFNKTTYWTITVQPVIVSVNYIAAGQYRITGTGFKPESNNPAGTIAGIPFVVINATDTEIIIEQDESTPIGEQMLIINNSDDETDYETIVVHDIAEPDWALGYPKIDSVAMQSADFLLKLDENCIVYYVVLPKNAVAPTSQQVKAGTDAEDNPVNSGSFSASNVETCAQVKHLSSSQSFNVYFVAEDLVIPPNLQIEPVKINVNTERKTPVNPDKPGVSFYDLSIPGDSNVDFIISDIRKLYRELALPDMRRL